MTIDESISILSNTAWLGTDEDRERTEEAVKTAMTALQKDGDTISRQTAIDAFNGVKVDEEDCTEYDIGYNDGIDFAVSTLAGLPSVQPERKKGKWIDRGEEYMLRWVCGECGRKDTHIYNFCPDCGLDMSGDEHENQDR